jgi:Mrp family chromosome partitioning ATPase/predicted Fe-Mo cluster-binding NifX family protein
MEKQREESRKAHCQQEAGKDGADREFRTHEPGTGESRGEFEERRRLQMQLSRIGHRIVVLSGKGGVGKSTMAVNLAVALSNSGRRVGLLDVDIHGPSVPTMLGLEGQVIKEYANGLVPVDRNGVKVMSLGFLLRDRDDAVIWRGPMKMKVIKQFLTDVAWGDLDYLIIDSPPGTGDEPLSVCQLIDRMDGAIIVTTPQKVAAVDVRKSITFCRQLQVPVIGVIENMSGFACPKCGEITPILRSGGGRQISEDMGVPFLGSIPMDPDVVEAGDSGTVYVESGDSTPAAKAMAGIVESVKFLGTMEADAMEKGETEHDKDGTVRIAIPVANGKLSMHFGHCESFALIDVDMEEKVILKRKDVDAPPHQPGMLPSWLAERGANMIIAGGMGQRAQGLFSQYDIEVVVGATGETPEHLVSGYLAGTLRFGENICDH